MRRLDQQKRTISVPTEKGKTLREKLIELLCEAMILFDRRKDEKDINPFEVFGEHLIANGVVISKMETPTKWIPVTERLPETERQICNDPILGEWDTYVSEAVLGYTTDGRMAVVTYETYEREWWTTEEGAQLDIAYWMPLPKAPKEGD